jgi:hypothetical protein
VTTAAPSTALATIQPGLTDAERLALAGYLAGYRGLTRDAYALDLRQFTTWCRTHSLALFAARRADIETFARDLEANGRARATVTRRLLVTWNQAAERRRPGRPSSGDWSWAGDLRERTYQPFAGTYLFLVAALSLAQWEGHLTIIGAWQNEHG